MKGEESIECQHRLAGRALGHRESGDLDLQGATHILASECTLAPPPALREGSGRRFKFPVRLGPSCLGLHSGVETSGSQTHLEFWPSSEGRGPQSSLPGVPVSRLCCRLPATCHLLQHPQCLAPHLWGRGVLSDATRGEKPQVSPCLWKKTDLAALCCCCTGSARGKIFLTVLEPGFFPRCPAPILPVPHALACPDVSSDCQVSIN